MPFFLNAPRVDSAEGSRQRRREKERSHLCYAASTDVCTTHWYAVLWQAMDLFTFINEHSGRAGGAIPHHPSPMGYIHRIEVVYRLLNFPI